MTIAPWLYVPALVLLALLLGTVTLAVRITRDDVDASPAPRWMAPTTALLVWAALLVVVVVGVEPHGLQVISLSLWGLMSVEALLLWIYTVPPAPTATLPPPPTYPASAAAPPDDDAEEDDAGDDDEPVSVPPHQQRSRYIRVRYERG